MPEGIKYRALSEVVYQNIRESIINCRYKSGQRLLLKKISDEMEVSITPVREALKKLEKDGLVELAPNNGAMVIDLGLRDIIELYDLRRQLECLAIELLGDNINKKLIEKLGEICDKDEDCLREDNLNLHVKYNNEFHELLIKSAQNKRLVKFYNEISGQLSILAGKTAKIPGWAKKSLTEHIEIVKALDKKNTELAKKIIFNHIQGTKEDILKKAKDVLKNREIDFDIKIEKII